MKLCGKNCTACCDFCVHAEHDKWLADDGHEVVGGPIACNLHNDNKHNNLAEWDGFCEDFECFRIGYENLDGLEVTVEEYLELEKQNFKDNYENSK